MELLSKYKKYSVGQLKLLYNNKNTAPEKLEVIKQILTERGALEESEETSSKKPESSEKQNTEKAPKAKEEKPKKAPKAKKASKPREKKTNENDPWLFKVGDEVKVPLAKNRKERAGEIIDGTIEATKEWEGFKEYVIKTELGKMTKRQNSLAKVNS